VARPSYPPARRGEVVDDYHGTKVPDPYRWLEDPEGDETVAWVRAQNELVDELVRRSPLFADMRSALEKRWNYTRFGVPRRYGGRLFYSRNDGLQNQPVIYVQADHGQEPTVVLDPNTLSDDGTVAVTNWKCSKDGKLIVYGRSSSGSDWQQIHIREIQTGREFDEVLHHCRWPSIAWNEDGSGFFYHRYPAPGTVPEEDLINFCTVWFHRLNTPQDDDVLVWEAPEDKTLTPHPISTHDGRWLLLHLGRTCDPKNRVYLRRLDSDGPFIKLVDDENAGYGFIGSRGDTLYFMNDTDAPRWRVVTCDLSDPAAPVWTEVIPQGEGVIDSVCLTTEGLVVSHEVHAHHECSLYDFDGRFERSIALPALGSVFDVWGRPDLSTVYFGFTSFLHPMTIYRYDTATDEMTTLYQPTVDFDPTPYETRQIFFTSKDGTQVPMFVTCRRDQPLDGSAPVLLYGYGGFAVSMTPGFGIPCTVWLERGGIYVVANIRGGNEYGRDWHEGGKRANKQNVFDDFIAAGEWLCANGYTRPERLAIWGGSNGGLLTAACMLQRPDLFGAVISSVPVIDMLRFHKFTCGRFWVSDYGNAEEDPEHFKFLFAYSPLHNVVDGVEYPPLLVMTADTDDRVVPSHGKKFVAELQHRAGGDGPLLLHVETRAGHGMGKPTSKQIEERALMLTFLFQHLAVSTAE